MTTTMTTRFPWHQRQRRLRRVVRRLLDWASRCPSVFSPSSLSLLMSSSSSQPRLQTPPHWCRRDHPPSSPPIPMTTTTTTTRFPRHQWRRRPQRLVHRLRDWASRCPSVFLPSSSSSSLMSSLSSQPRRWYQTGFFGWPLRRTVG